jgi:hypothetical protein
MLTFHRWVWHHAYISPSMLEQNSIKAPPEPQTVVQWTPNGVKATASASVHPYFYLSKPTFSMYCIMINQLVTSPLCTLHLVPVSVLDELNVVELNIVVD